MARGHAEATLIPMVAEAMKEAEVDFAELDLVAATLGPGSFTGVRIAVAAARGFALAPPQTGHRLAHRHGSRSFAKRGSWGR